MMTSTNTTRMRSFCYAICILILLATATMAQTGSPGIRRITLEEAKAAAAGTAAARSVAQLEVDAARYHRQAAQADYFPKLGADFLNAHYNKFMGQTVQVLNRSVGVPLFGKDWTAVALTAVQPVTQLL